MLVVDSGAIGSGASGRCGGFINASITHGIPHGHARWPDEMAAIVEIQRALWDDTLRLVGADGVIEPVGKFTVATRPHHVEADRPHRRAVARLRRGRRPPTTASAIRDLLGSATYLAGYHLRSANGLCDPARLAWRLADLAESAGARLAEHSHVDGPAPSRRGRRARRSPTAPMVRAGKVLLCTNASPPLLRRLRAFVAPVYDHVIVTEPLSDAQWRAIGWRQRVGITDAGNQFHYYRPTPDGRILFGGWEATYHFGGRVDERYERDDAVHALLYRHLVDTFPALDGVARDPRLGRGGRLDESLHPDDAHGGRRANRLGRSGSPASASAPAASAPSPPSTSCSAGAPSAPSLTLVRRQPIPFPPEPLRWAVIQFTKRALVREDATGRRGIWLRALDRLGVGFDT